MAEETKHDVFLKRVQVTIAILAGLATLILGIYNVKKTLFSANKPEETPYSAPAEVVQPEKTPDKPSPIKSALEDVGASWIKSLAKNSPQDADQTKAQ